ncbi:LPXTG cell wall anchor domain-containing protein [Mammaliicoccus sciuri]|nr:LPXTG cell wall anchor domain-containing protein [Mammaliicoccus sciuri]MEB6195321.1 LPXTG cell wall anchor domain-containing protein [Mammaliicoccus sciuri]
MPPNIASHAHLALFGTLFAVLGSLLFFRKRKTDK